MAAYPVVSGPYGFKPVNLIGGQVFLGRLAICRFSTTMAPLFITAIL